MSDSPLITAELREYFQRFKIEEIVSKAINSLAHKLPSDPFTFLAGYYSELSDEPPSIFELHSREIFLDSRASLEVSISCQSKGQTFTAPSFVFSPGFDEQNYTVDTDRLDGKGMRTAARTVEALKNLLFEQDVANQRKIDSLLVKEEGLGSNVVVSVSFACAIAASFFKRTPLFKHIFEKLTRREWDGAAFPKLMLPLLFTGKSNGSKVKFARWILYETNSEKHDGQLMMDASRKLYETLRKILASGKGGEAGLRIFSSGFIPPSENIAECFKLIEDTVNQSGFSLGEDFLLAIDCASEEYYLKDMQKYEMEGFKNPPDVAQITEFYAKLLNDKAYIGMIFDPFVLEDVNSWKTLANRLPSKRLGSIKLAKDHERFRTLAESEETQDLWLPSVISTHYSYQLTNLIDLAKAASKRNVSLILTENPFESLDQSLVDLAVGLKCEFLQMSAPIKSGSLSKYNRIIQLKS
jgi:enolase